jgi:hypothetical protein
VIGFAVMTFGDERAHLALLAVSPTYQTPRHCAAAACVAVGIGIDCRISSLHVELRAGNTRRAGCIEVPGFVETLRLSGLLPRAAKARSG